jgi:tetratricopeptide (TPR) repeat protein
LLAAGVAAAGPPFATDAGRVEALVAAGAEELERFAVRPRNQRIVVYTSVGLALGCIPLSALGIRTRRRERARERAVREQRSRAPRVFEAAQAASPLRLRSGSAREQATPDGLPPLGELPPEVAARAAALHAASVREAAERSRLLRAASERSETRRRAAALRARGRREERAEIAMEAPAAAAPPPAAPARAPAPAAAPESPGAPRVAILRSSGPLTLEWLESTLARDPGDLQARLDLCTALLVAERFRDAERVAREGLASDPSDGRLCLRLSEALAGQDRTDEALDTAVRAVRNHRSRKAILHLTRISALAHRLAPGDGPRLRKALEGRPHDPSFLYALGVFESLHGSPDDALTLLRLALRQERSPRWRRIVSREIARLRARELAAGRPQKRRAAG